MDNTFWQSVASTSWWVYLIMAYLLWASLTATKPRVTTLKTMVVYPAFFTILSLIYLIMLVPASPLDCYLWLGAAFLGTGSGFLHYQLIHIKALADTKSIEIPGSWSLFIMIFLVLIAKFYFGFNLEITPQLIHHPAFAATIYFLNGLFCGLFLGRAYQAARHIKLAKIGVL